MSDKQPLVAIIMGSDSDWPVMQAAAQMLKDFGVPYEARVVSAHRTRYSCLNLPKPQAQGLSRHHCGCGWCGASAGHGGGQRPRCRYWRAGALQTSARPGFTAFHRADAQRDSGGNFAIGEAGAANAGLFAVAMLATGDADLAKKLADFRTRQSKDFGNDVGEQCMSGKPILPPATLGMLGGGQLGRFFVIAAHNGLQGCCAGS